MFMSKEIMTMTHLIELHGLVVDQNLHSEQSQIAMTACRVWKPNYLMYSVHHSWGSQLCANSSAGGSSDDSERVQHVDWTEIEFVRVWELVNTNIRVGWLRMWYGGGDGAGWPRNGR